MVDGYVGHFRIPMQGDALRAEALEWATTRGSRSGRVAWQYVQDLAGRLGVEAVGLTPHDRQVLPPLSRNGAGSTGVEPLRISKCSCGAATLPVCPALAMICPRFTGSSRFTMISLACA